MVLAAGPNMTITSNGNTLTISSASTDSAITAFQKGLVIDLPDSGNPNFQDFEIQIPANKRLVIECLTMDMFADNGARIFLSVTTHIGSGENVEHNFPPFESRTKDSLPINKSEYMQMDQWHPTFSGSNRVENRHSARSVSPAIWWTSSEAACSGKYCQSELTVEV